MTKIEIICDRCKKSAGKDIGSSYLCRVNCNVYLLAPFEADLCVDCREHLSNLLKKFMKKDL